MKLLTGTKTAIEALTVLEGQTAYATDTDEMGNYDGSTWYWISLNALSARRDFWNGTFRETFDALVTSDGATITMSLEQSGGGDLIMQFSDGATTLDCTPAATIELTAGTDASPQANYIYVLQSTKAITKSTSAWPSAEHIRISYFLVPSATFVQANGCYINQNWNDHLVGTDSQGHLAHMTEKIRSMGATYFSGVSPNGATASYYTISAGHTEWISTSGVIAQMHKHTFPAVDTSGGDVLLVKNWSGDAYHDITDLFDITADSTGTTINNNRYFSLVFWGVANKSGEYETVLVNLPSGDYTTQADAENDVSGYDDYTIPREFNIDSSTGFLICRSVFQMGATWTHISTTDLRGATVAEAGGSSVNDHGGLGGLTDDDHTHMMLNWDNVLVVHSAGTTRVPGFYTSIQDAHDAASAGDVILICPGTYVEDVTITTTVGIFGFDNGLTVVQGQLTVSNWTYARNLKFTDADSPIVNVTAGESVFDHCRFVGSFSGDGIVVQVAAANLYLRDCYVYGGSDSGKADGVKSNHANANVYLDNCDVSHSDSVGTGYGLLNSGGTISIAFTSYDDSSGTITYRDADPIATALISTTLPGNWDVGNVVVSTDGSFATDLINEYTGAAGVTVEGVVIKDSTVYVEDGIEVGSSAETKGTVGQVYVEESASTGAVQIGWDSPSYGVQLRAHVSAGGWDRGYGIANTGATEVYTQFGVFASGQTLSYSYIGSAYNETHVRFYKYDATTPDEVIFTDVNVGIGTAGGTFYYPLQIVTSGAYKNQYMSIHVTQDYASNDATVYGYFADLTGSNAGQTGRGLYVRHASTSSFVAAVGLQIALEGAVGASHTYGVYQYMNSTATNAGNYYAYFISQHASATVTGNSFMFYASSAATVTGTEYGIYVVGVDRNYVEAILGVGNSDYTAGINVGSSGDAWSTASWNKGVELQHGSTLKWKYSNNDAYGIGVTGTPATIYFMSTTSDGTGTAIAYWFKYAQNSGLATLSADLSGGESSLALKVVTTYGYCIVGPTNSSYSHFSTDITNGFYFNKPITVNGTILHYGTTKVDDIGASANAWDDVWADDFQNVADFLWADEHQDVRVSDVQALRQIRPSDVRDERTGMMLIDDDTVPEWMLTRNKHTGDVVYDPDGKPYISLKMMTSVLMGAVRELSAEIDELKERIYA